ncbi:MAG: PAS domain-containing protein [Nitrospinae bacterium]|nr:PAS domain-containing protein [Nitrospinota bacterium]
MADTEKELRKEIAERKRAEAELRKSEEMFKSLARVSPVGIFQADKAGTTTYVNDRWCQISGMTREQSVGTGWSNAIHPDVRERVFKGWYDSVQAKTPFKMEYRVLKPDGSIVWLFGQAEEDLDETGAVAGYVGSVTDITDRRKTDDEIREKEERLALATVNNGVGIWDWNLITQEMVWDDSMYALYHIRREDFSRTEEAWRAALHPDDLERGDREVEDTISGKKP